VLIIRRLKMKIALIGVSGRVGSRLAAELLRRGHSVTGIARNVKNVLPQARLELREADATNSAVLAPLIAGHDAVISALRFVSSDARVLIAALKKAEVKRLLVVGGAGSLEVKPGRMLVDAPGFPEAYKSESQAGVKFLNVLRTEADIDWTFLSPSADFEPGKRTGKFRTGDNALLTDTDGRSWISMEDFAVAMVDELEHPRHIRQRFTVGY